ncbi:MAG: RidA family protein [Bryobacteraceae bacterium]|jgi:enamine deaminase RidA (YjgF/YER057c/UK114 family)
MSVHERLQQLGLKLPELAQTTEFLRVNIIDDLAFVSGHASFADGDFCYRGKIGRELDLSEGRRAAELAALGCLTSLENSIGSLDAVRRIVKLNGYVNCEPEFDDLPRVTDAASKLLVDLFGDSGRHARTTVGVASLPQGVAVEIELIAQFGRE